MAIHSHNRAPTHRHQQQQLIGFGLRSSSSSSSTSSSSIVSKARTAFHSAAAKAEKVFTDIKSDFKPDRDSDKQSPNNLKRQLDSRSPSNEGEMKNDPESKHVKWKPPPIGTKQDWQDRLKNLTKGKKGADETEKAQVTNTSSNIYDENLVHTNLTGVLERKNLEADVSSEVPITSGSDKVVPASVVRQLATAVENCAKFKSIKDFLASSGDSSPIRERGGLSLSAMKSLVLREKDDKSDFEEDEKKVVSLINSLISSEGHIPVKDNGPSSEVSITLSSLPKDIHAAPPESFVVKLAEIIGSYKTLRKMALFWCRIVAELRGLWLEDQHVPGIPTNEIPDLRFCLLYQQLQVINCCVSRKKRRVIATKALDSVIRETNSDVEISVASEDTSPATGCLYAKISSGELILRLGADHPCENLTMLETGAPIFSPITQEGPLLTEDVIRETEEFVLRTGSVGAGCSQLLSDMQAFKAANPGCILEDFVRWHSPPDWTRAERENEAEGNFDGTDTLSQKGQLSTRMQKEGNLWRELWGTAKPVPAFKQTPLFDEDFTAEGILNEFEDIAPSLLFGQLFVSLLGYGMVLAEAALSSSNDLSKLFFECKDYIVATFQTPGWNEKVNDIYQVYHTVEKMLNNPEEILKIVNQQEDSSTTSGEPKRKFMRLLYFGKDSQSKKPPQKEQNNSEETPPPCQSFASFFDTKSSLFSRKPPKPESALPTPVHYSVSPKPESSSPVPVDKSMSPKPESSVDKSMSLVENEWTVV